MKAFTLFSGSTGNCIYLKEKNTEILIDAGSSMRRIEKALESLGTSLSNLSGIFITHEHSDHTKALPVIAGQLSVPVYCQREVAKTLYLDLLNKEKKREATNLAKCIRTVQTGMEYEIGDVLISPFATPHDSVESQGFVIGDRELGIATDLGHVSWEAENYLLGCRSVILESNHDPDMLWNGSYPGYLKERVASDHGHLSNPDCASFAQKLFSAGCRNLTLFHLSEENNTPEIAFHTNQEALAQVGAVVGESIDLRIAQRFEVTRVL